MKIIVAFKSAECLVSLLRAWDSLGFPFYVQTGFVSELRAAEEDWKLIPEQEQIAIENASNDFIAEWQKLKS